MYDPRVARAASNGIELEYEVIGSPADPPLLLIMGLGGQLLALRAPARASGAAAAILARCPLPRPLARC